ncbi:MAG TPA: OB-fold nucleic acid binding domain-containing protein, partial [Puia sp.]
MFNKRVKIKDALGMSAGQEDITVMGWVRTMRNNQFIALNDGSCNENLQLVLELGHFDENLLKKITTGTSIRAVGKLVKSPAKGQQVELKAEIVEILGISDADKFPLQPKKHSLEFLREIAHLRFRTNTFGSVFRV